MEQNHLPSWRERNIIFIGFMGVGKTTVGQLVAKKLMRDFIDIDQEIEARLGMPVTEVFAKHGEPYFRSVERETIKDIIINSRLKIISLGGGAFLQDEVRELCLERGIVFFLDLSWDDWLHRLEKIKEDRPVLQNKEINEIEELYQKRYPIYSLNNSSVKMKDEDPETLASYIVNCLKDSWRQYDREEGVSQFNPYIYTSFE